MLRQSNYLESRQTYERIFTVLGVTLYHLVTGKTLSEPPFEVRPIRQWDPSLPEGLEHIIHKATQTEPEQRYQSCAELSYDLANIEKLTEGYKESIRRLVAFIVPMLLFFILRRHRSGLQRNEARTIEQYVSLMNPLEMN